MSDIHVEGIRVAIGDHPILNHATLDVDQGVFAALVGPNGSGKSTLLRTIYRALRPDEGIVQVTGTDVWQLTARASAQRTAVVTQERHADFEFTVLQVVLMGRIPHQRPLDNTTDHDLSLARNALREVNMAGLERRIFSTLSGGEKQRVLVARALTQQSPVILLDEPTNHLDIRAQLELVRLIRNLGITTLAALHDLNLAATYCDLIHVMRDGEIVASGIPEEVLTTELIEEVFDVHVERLLSPETGRLLLAFS